MTRSSAGRSAAAVVALLAGMVVGGCTVAVHGYWWGLLLGVAATAALLVAIPGGWWGRPPFALGWVAVLLALGAERPEGDQLVVLTGNGYALLGAGVGVLVGGVLGVRRPPDRAAAINVHDVPTS